mmetsp:Transcript_49516/g.149227  ORF Transcript_49516/g.149227 Transcript_49516/m.149227 type:complete len:212 (-) Transcript_49516:136-771(-)
MEPPPPARLPLLHRWRVYRPPPPPLAEIIVVDPSTALPMATVSLASRADVDAARRALSSWSLETTPAERRRRVKRLLEIYERRGEDMARLISAEMGAPIDMARNGQFGAGSYHMEAFLEVLDEFEFERVLPNVYQEDSEDDEPATKILMDPVGVVSMITPWNLPLNQIVLKVVPALLVRCTCVLKPSELSPLLALLFAELMDEAGFPPDPT